MNLPSPSETERLHAEVDRLRGEMHTYVQSGFTAADAWWVCGWLRDEAISRDGAIAIDVRRGEQLLAAAATEGVSADLGAWAERKGRLVRRFALPSLLVGTRMRARGQGLDHFGLSPAHYATLGGGCPVTVEGVGVVGSVAISGLTETEDHELVVEALRALAKRTP